jgi:hypothetical protein
MPKLAKTVGLSVAIGKVLFWGWLMVTKIVAIPTRRRRRIAILVGRRLFKIISFWHISVTGRLVTVLRPAVQRSTTVSTAHAVVIVVVGRHLLLLLLTFRRFRRQQAAATHWRPALVTTVLETGHIQRPILVAIVHVAARLVFRVRSSHVRRRYRQQNVCQHPATATRQRQRST